MKPVLIALSVISLGCDLPRDTSGSLDSIRTSGILRAGYTTHEPWVIEQAGTATGPEADVVSAFAQSLGAHVEWRYGSESQLFEALETLELDVIIGGLTADNPGLVKLGMTRPYIEVDKKQHVAAVAPGESRLLMEFERVLRAHAPAVAARVGGRPVS